MFLTNSITVSTEYRYLRFDESNFNELFSLVSLLKPFYINYMSFNVKRFYIIGTKIGSNGETARNNTPAGIKSKSNLI